MANKQEIIKFSLQGDATQLRNELEKVRRELLQLSANTKIDLNTAELKKTIQEINSYKKIIDDSLSIGSNSNINFNQLEANAKKANVSIDSLIKDINKYSSVTGISAINTDKLSDKMMALEAPAEKAATAIDKFRTSLFNSFRYNVVNDFVDSFLSSGDDIVSLLEETDNRLTQIQIVSGKTATAMQAVREESILGAKALASSTQDVLSAYETYYQQGLSSSEAQARAQATIMAANISDQSVSTTAEQVTAVLNGFNISAENTIEILGKMANIGAKTATDFSEIATAMQKVASASDVAGLSLDDTLAAMATISSVTREAPETVGTSLNAILGRIGNLKVDDEYTSAIEEMYKSTNSGLTLFDEQTGLLKEASVILTELAEKWNILDINQKRAITSQLAGTRQANRLLALMENWDMFEQYRDYAQNSSNALEEQNDIYLQSVEAAKNRMQTAWDSFWLSLFDEDTLKGAYNFIADIVNLFSEATNSAGGLLAVVRSISGVLSRTVGKQLGQYFGSLTEARVLNSYVKNEESQKRFNEAQKATNEFLTKQGLQTTKLLNLQERQTLLSREQSEEYEKITSSLKEQASIIESNEKQANSKVFSDLDYSDINNTEGKLETNKTDIASASDFKRFVDKYITGGVVFDSKAMDTIVAGDESNPVQYIKDILGGKKAEEVQIDTNKGIKETYAYSLQAVKDVMDKLRNSGNKTIEKIFDSLELEIENQVKLGTKDIAEQFPTVYDKAGRKRKGVGNIIARGDENINSLSSDEANIYNSYLEAQKVLNDGNKSITNVYSLLDIIDKKYNPNQLGITEDNEDKFYSDLLNIIRKAFQKIETEKPENGLSINEQANIENKAKTNISQAKTTLEEDVLRLEAIRKAGQTAALIEKGFIGISSLSSALTGFNQLLNDNLDLQDKLSIATNTLGSILSTLPGAWGLVGFAISSLGPTLIELFEIGISESERFQHKVENLQKTNEALTLNIKEQKVAWNNIDEAYKSLVEAYANGAKTYDDLDENMKQSYDQVAEYVQNYAPELIKYYDAEGKAVLDLTDKYGKLNEQKQYVGKSYLETQLNYDEIQTYAPLTKNVGSNAEAIVSNYAYQLQNVEKLKIKIGELQSESLRTGKDLTEEISALEEELTNANSVITNVAQTWDDNVVDVITKSNAQFYALNDSMKNSIISLSSYNNYINSDFSLTPELFINKTNDLISVLGSLSDEVIQKFEDMDSAVRDSLLSMSQNMSLSRDELKSFLTDITEEDYISGEFLSDYKETIDPSKNAYYSERRENMQNAIDRINSGEDRGDVLDDLNEKYNNEFLSYDKDTLAVSDRYASEIRNSMTEEQKDSELTGLLSDQMAEEAENFKEEIESIDSIWLDSMRELANSSDEAFNKIAESFLEMKETLEQTPETDAGYEDLRERTEKLYAVLQGDNEEYFQEWQRNNTEAINSISEAYGIYAGNYATYNEYMSALDEQKAKLKVLYEIAATEGAEGLQKALLENKKENILKEIDLEKRGAEAALLISADEATQKDVIDAIEKKSRLLKLRERLQAEKEGASTAVEISAEESDAILYNQGSLVNAMKSNLNNTFGAAIVAAAIGATGAAALSGSYKTGIDVTIKAVDEAIAKIDEYVAQTAAETEGYADALESIGGLSNLEQQIANFDYGNIDFDKYKVDFKDLTGSGGGGGANSLGGSGGGGGSGSDNEVADMELELDVLRPYIIALEEISHQLDIISTKKEQVWGAQYLDYLQQEIDLNKESLKLNEGKLVAAQNQAELLKVQLASGGAEFTDYGAISNYNELLEQKMNAANALSGEAKETAQDEVEKFQELMDKYEEYALDTVRDIETEILDIKNTLAENAKEQIEYVVSIVVEAKDNKNELIDFLAEVQKYKKGEVNFSIDVSNNANKLITTLDSLKEIDEKTSVDNLIKQVMENPDLQGMTDKQLEIIQNRINELQELGSELIEFEEAFSEAFADAFDEALSLLDDQLSKYNNITAQYNYMLYLAETLNDNNLDFNTETYDKIIDIYKNNLNASKELAETIKASRDQFEVGTEDWRVANEKYLEAQADVMDREKELIEALEDKFDSTASIGRDKIENALFNGGTLEDAEDQLEKLQEEREKYLDTEQKIYSLDKMRYEIQKDIDSYQFNTEAQKELEDWMNKELEYLNNKKDLSQDDLDLAEKQYAVLKARIDMENAYNNRKYTAMLQRNADGTYGYMYIQDTSEYEAASQSYRDAIDDLYNYSLERNEALQEENIKLKQEALEEYDKIVAQLKAGMITSEEATKLLQETFNELQQNLVENAEEQQLISQQAIASTQLQILMNELMNTESMERIQDISSETQTIISENLTAAGLDYDDFVNSKLYQELDPESMFTKDVLDEWQKLDEIINNDMDSIANDFNFDNEDSLISQIVNSINEAYADFNKTVEDALNNAIEKEEDLITSTEELNKESEELNKQLADEIDRVTELKKKYNDLRDSVTDAIDKITNSLNKLTNAQNKVTGEANKGNSSSGSGSGSSSSSSSSGSSGSSKPSGGDGVPRVGDYVTYLGGTYYSSSTGGRPLGTRGPGKKVKITYMANGAPYPIHVQSSDSAYGWLKQSQISGYDTGGYTGDWNSKEGRLAILHEKELVLNKDDTKNMLKSLELSEELLRKNISNYKIQNNKESSSINYNNFDIQFPSVTNSSEIERALENLPAIAQQYLGRKR